SANHRITKTGKPFGVFVLEDYTDSYEIAVFGEDYLKHKSYINEGYFVQIRGRVQERFRQEGNWGFEITNVQLLSELEGKLAKSFPLQIPLDHLDENLYHQIPSILRSDQDSEGNKNCQLRFKIVDLGDQ